MGDQVVRRAGGQVGRRARGRSGGQGSRQTCRHDEANSCISQLCECAQNGIYSVMLVKCTVDMTVGAMSEFFDRVFGCDSNFHFKTCLDCRYIILFLSFTFVLALKSWTLYIVVMFRKINYFSGEEQVLLFP